MWQRYKEKQAPFCQIISWEINDSATRDNEHLHETLKFGVLYASFQKNKPPASTCLECRFSTPILALFPRAQVWSILQWNDSYAQNVSLKRVVLFPFPLKGDML